ncbi:MAG: hypothetical protein KDD61_10125 [Bdellovibrionales bacterium]|nr:hypothetical protein [Bdellovibrionales bacterium]
MNHFTSSFLLLCLVFSYSQNTEARPEYALKHRINRCTTCHLSPVGGGLRNIEGKTYGTHSYKPGAWTQKEEFSLDLRSLFIQPEQPSSTSGGLSLMAVSAGANIAITPKETDGVEVRAVYNHLLSGFATGARDAYLRMKTYEDSETAWHPQYYLAGQFHAPFGLITDEHETYTKLQSSSTWNNFEMGLLMAGNPFHSLHWDLSVVNGERGGGGRGTGRALLWGTTGNLRYMPAYLPFLLGASYSQHKRKADEPAPTAVTVYSMLPLGNLSHQLAQGTLSLEYAEAQYWNNDIATNFIQDTGYKAAIVSEKSAAWFAKLEWEINRKWLVSYQYEGLAFNKEYPEDACLRHSYGIKYWAASNTYVMGRFADSKAQAPSESGSTKRYAVDSFYVVFQTSI